MTEPEVEKILGRGARTQNPDGSVSLNYTLRENWAGSINAGYQVRLVDGKVVSSGRDTPPVTEQPKTIFIAPAPH